MPINVFLVYLVIDSPQHYGYNYGLGYIAAVLEQGGHHVRYIVLRNRKDIDSFYEVVYQYQPDIIGFSSTTSQFGYLLEIIPVLKKISRSFLVCGGAHPSLDPECIYRLPQLDAVVRGEGEYPLLELADAIGRGESYTDIKNFWFRLEDGSMIRNPLRPFIENLDNLPFPYKEKETYQNTLDLAGGINHFIFSRGCTFDCTYCSNKALSMLARGRYFRQVTPKRAIEEIRRDMEIFQFKSIRIDDDTINLDKKWFYEFFTLYKEKYNYPFRCNIRPGMVNLDMMRLLKDAGARAVGIGIEHGNEDFRRRILHRDISDKQIIETFDLFRQVGLSHGGDFIMVGLPFETMSLFLDTVRLCRKVHASGDISIFVPYPGTVLGKICKERNWLLIKDRCYRERQEALLDFPHFKRKDIQLCRDIFPFLLKVEIIPLNVIILKVLGGLYRIHQFMHRRSYFYRLGCLTIKKLFYKMEPGFIGNSLK